MASSQAPEQNPAVPKSTLSPELRAYRDWLVQADHKASEAYDKAVMTLSGGALAISITFIHDIAPSPLATTIYRLIFAWGAFGLSITAILISQLTSCWALRNGSGPGGRWFKSTRPDHSFSITYATRR
jgi:hypothetical protein